ncbi:MAG: DsrE family protein [Desulfosalsimonadaceae bacterium]
MTNKEGNTEDTLVILWTTKDPEVAENMIFMYAKKAKSMGWWENIRVVLWGPSANLMANHAELQGRLEDVIASGVKVLACKTCADTYGVSGILEGLGIEVLYMGEHLTNYLKSGVYMLTL